MPLIKRTRVLAIIKAHQPDIDWAYEHFDCTCGWEEPGSPGLKTVKDGSKTWIEHLRKQFKAVADG